MSNYPPPQQVQPSSMGHGVRIGIGIVIGIVLILALSMGACVACGGLMLGIGSREAARQAQENSASNNSPVARIGQRVEKGGVALTVQTVSRKKSLGRFETADQGHSYVIVDVLLEATDRNEAPYNPMYFKVKDSDGVEYNSGFTTAKDSLSSGNLYKGDKVRGNIVFEVREKASGLVLTYEPLVIFGGFGPIRILLE